MRPKAKKAEPAPRTGAGPCWCPKCKAKRLAMGGRCLNCGGKV